MLRVLWNEWWAGIFDIVSCSASIITSYQGHHNCDIKSPLDILLDRSAQFLTHIVTFNCFNDYSYIWNSLTIPMKLSSTVLAAILLAQPGIAHPGQSQDELQNEIQQRAEYFSTHKRTLADCADKHKARGNDALLQARRSGKLENLRKKRSIDTCKWS